MFKELGEFRFPFLFVVLLRHRVPSIGIVGTENSRLLSLLMHGVTGLSVKVTNPYLVDRAGAEVTAMGVLGDVIKILQRLK